MTEAADEVTRSNTAPEAPAADDDWFTQIPFNPRKGLNSVLPLDVPQRPDTEPADPDGENR
ncbi:MAG TPA: hypothetical protein VF612_03375 [Jatrophihabitans sp.]|jgi:hypothetical protein|uniref:hypothetical protein n=1 Tax=Jatrophihabitans sp. TaxID=1932789 RepID=UPI002F2166C6